MTRRAKRAVTWFLFGVTAALLAGCASTPPSAQVNAAPGNRAAAQPAMSEAELLRQPVFQGCELHAFIAWDASRNAVLFHESEVKMLASPNVGAFQQALYREIFARIGRHDLHDYNQFAAEQLLACAQRNAIPLPVDKPAVTTCMARLDVLMIARARMLQGLPEDTARAAARRLLPSRTRYPAAVIDALTTKVYAVTSDDAFYNLRGSVFESCVLQ